MADEGAAPTPKGAGDAANEAQAREAAEQQSRAEARQAQAEEDAKERSMQRKGTATIDHVVVSGAERG